MEKINNQKAINRNFFCLFLIYMACIQAPTMITNNIDNIVKYLSGASINGIALTIAFYLGAVVASTIFFGIFTEKITANRSRKNVYIFTNLTIIIGLLIISLSINYLMFFIGYLISAIGTGATSRFF